MLKTSKQCRKLLNNWKKMPNTWPGNIFLLSFKIYLLIFHNPYKFQFVFTVFENTVFEKKLIKFKKLKIK